MENKKSKETKESKKENPFLIPKGHIFKKWFVRTIGFCIFLFISFVCYVFISNSSSNIKNSESNRVNSDLASQEITSLQSKQVPVLENSDQIVKFTNHNYMINQEINNLSEGQLVYKDGKLYKVGADGELYPYNGKLKEGDTVWKDGKEYVVGADGELHPLDTNHATSQYSPGQFVSKDGKLYKVGADGKLHPYNGKLKEGDVVWKDGKAYVEGADGKLHLLHNGEIFKGADGKPYMFKDGKIIPLSAQGAAIGDLVKVGNKMYKIGADGKLHPYNGKPSAGETVWADGKINYIGADGKMHALEEGKIFLGKDGQLYIVKDGKLVKYEKPCFSQSVNGKWYISDKTGKLHEFKEGSKCVSDDGYIVKLQNNKIIKIPPEGATQSTKPESNDVNQQWLDYMSNITDSKVLSAPLTNNKPQEQQPKKSSLALENGQAHGLQAPSPVQANSYASQNAQDEKIAFMKNAKDTDNSDLKNSGGMNPYPYSLTVGSIIPATLITGINSDLPGQIVAQVSRNIYDSKTGKFLLIPQGTKLIGIYSSQVSYGQSRVLMAWNRLEFPNGYRYNLEGMAGADLSGYAGIEDQTDNHYFRIFSSALLFSVFGTVSQLTQPNNQNTNGPTSTSIVYSAIGQQLTQVASNLIQKNMNVQPTDIIRPGANFNVLASRTMVFDSPYQYDGGINV